MTEFQIDLDIGNIKSIINLMLGLTREQLLGAAARWLTDDDHELPLPELLLTVLHRAWVEKPGLDGDLSELHAALSAAGDGP